MKDLMKICNRESEALWMVRNVFDKVMITNIRPEG